MVNANLTSLMSWVWAANPTRLVRDNAKLIFGRNGSLALVDADDRVAWQTHTANRGVVDIKLLPNGNLVLLNKQGGFVRQSFHYPNDTLLVGQEGLGLGSSSSYSKILEDKQIGLFFKSPHSSKPLLYYYLVNPNWQDGPLMNVTFNVAPVSDGPDYANELRFDYFDMHHGRFNYAQPKYNSTLSLFRLGLDGNILIYTYYEKGLNNPWEETFTEFSRNWYASECLMPEKCGPLGICDDNECIACPTPKGLMGWSKDCKPSKLPSCNVRAANVSYYIIEGVDHFLNIVTQGDGPMKIDECRKKCSNDCKCMAFFYRKDSSMCLLTAQLNTLMKAIDSSSTERIAYIKYAN